jgi:tripartite ATP-independent transporter DctP family solute receptor
MLLRILLGAVLAFGTVVDLHAAEFTFKLGWATADHPSDLYAVGAREFKTRIEAASNGRIEIQLFPNRQIGDEKELLEGVRFGTVDAAMITNGILATVVTGYQVNDLPFIYANETQAHRVLDGPIGQELAKQLASRGVILLGSMEGGFRHMLNNVRPVNVPLDLKGVKYRVQQSPVFIEMFSSLGGSAVPMAWGETFTALQQGTIDGFEFPVPFVLSLKMYEVTKFLSLTNHIYGVVGLTISKRAFDRLPPDLRDLVVKTGAEATRAQRTQSAAIVEASTKELLAKGMKINAVSDLAPFRAAVRPVYERFRGSIGTAVLEDTLKAVQ